MTRCDDPAPHDPHVLDCEGVPVPVPEPLPPADAETLHVMQASMQFSDPRAQKRADVDRVLYHSGNPDLIGLTETTKASGLLGLFTAHAPEAGYVMVPGPGVTGSSSTTLTPSSRPATTTSSTPTPATPGPGGAGTGRGGSSGSRSRPPPGT